MNFRIQLTYLCVGDLRFTIHDHRQMHNSASLPDVADLEHAVISCALLALATLTLADLVSNFQLPGRCKTLRLMRHKCHDGLI